MTTNEYIQLINDMLDNYIPEDTFPQNIFKAMKYTVTLPGKRIRPIMCLEICNKLGGKVEDAIPTACAIEMLHAQTLIHDDLPCMDNDDFRRGKPTNHKVFSEAIAVLAGDALLSFAPQIILKYSTGLDDCKLIKIIKEYTEYAGAYGVIAGQAVDIVAEKNWRNNAFNLKPEQLLDYIHTHKTADLFKLSLRTGAIIANATDETLNEITNFAQNLGVAFQIADDILDVVSSFQQMGKTIGKDKSANKLTYVTLYGLDEAKCKLTCILNNCYDIIEGINIKSSVLSGIVSDIGKRVGI